MVRMESGRTCEHYHDQQAYIVYSLPIESPVSFEWQGCKYIWKVNDRLQIAVSHRKPVRFCTYPMCELYEENDPRNPISWLQTSEREGTNATAKALLILQVPEAREIMDAVVVSLLVVEGNLRVREARYHSGDGRVDRLSFK